MEQYYLFMRVRDPPASPSLIISLPYYYYYYYYYFAVDASLIFPSFILSLPPNLSPSLSLRSFFSLSMFFGDKKINKRVNIFTGQKVFFPRTLWKKVKKQRVFPNTTNFLHITSPKNPNSLSLETTCAHSPFSLLSFQFFPTLYFFSPLLSLEFTLLFSPKTQLFSDRSLQIIWWTIQKILIQGPSSPASQAGHSGLTRIEPIVSSLTTERTPYSANSAGIFNRMNQPGLWTWIRSKQKRGPIWRET